MLEFFINTAIWTFAFYGFFEFLKNIIYVCTYTKCKTDGINVIVTVKNQEDKIEGLLRTIIFKILYGKDDIIKNIIVADLKSDDKTKEIVQKLSIDNEMIKVVSWKECKDIIDLIDQD